eukprot:TRINITY_DN29735_c0_g1_i1.p1 TRINITY_DN29735_c0_g1~~TRINITY_DN29735_c0_g1_i1.p1  ORF type:complete len:755 (+),score=207.65 TRINITY_DN29735_c0_g1_i1:48-2312(+)
MREVTEVWPSVAAAALAAALYVATANNSAGGGDSGELLSVAWDFGVAHPPGYPLWVMLTWVMGTLWPEWGMYLVSPLAGGVCVGFVHAAVLLATGSHAAAVLAAGAQAVAPANWQWSTTSEVFALNNACCAVLLYCGTRYIIVPYRRSSTLLWTAFATAVALGNQHTCVVFIVPSAALVLTHYVAVSDGFDTEKLVVLGFSAAVFLVAFFLLYLQLFASTAFNTSVHVWGAAFDLQGVVTHMLRREYGTFSLAQQTADYAQVDFWGSLMDWSVHTVQQLPVAVLALSALGLFVPIDLTAPAAGGDAPGTTASSGKGSRKGKPKPRPAVRLGQRHPDRDRFTLTSLQVLLLTCLASYLTFFGVLGNLPLGTELFRSVQERFWLQPFLIIAVASGLGVAKAVTVSRGRLAATRFSWLPLEQVALTAATVWIAASAVGQYSMQDRRGRTWVEDFGADVLRPLKPGAVLFTKGDIVTNSVRYAQTVRGVRPDVVNVDIEMLRSEWYVPRLKAVYGDAVDLPGPKYSPKGGFVAEQLISANIGKRGVYLAYDFHEKDRGWRKSYTPVPTGIADELLPTAVVEKWPTAVHKATVAAVRRCYPGAIERNWNASAPSDPAPREAWDKVVSGDYWASLYRAGQYLADKSALLTQRGQPKRAAEAAETAGDVLAHVFNHGGNHTTPYVRALASRTLAAVLLPKLNAPQPGGDEALAALAKLPVAALREFVRVAADLPAKIPAADVASAQRQLAALPSTFTSVDS